MWSAHRSTTYSQKFCSRTSTERKTEGRTSKSTFTLKTTIKMDNVYILNRYRHAQPRCAFIYVLLLYIVQCTTSKIASTVSKTVWSSTWSIFSFFTPCVVCSFVFLLLCLFLQFLFSFSFSLFYTTFRGFTVFLLQPFLSNITKCTFIHFTQKSDAQQKVCITEFDVS